MISDCVTFLAVCKTDSRKSNGVDAEQNVGREKFKYGICGLV